MINCDKIIDDDCNHNHEYSSKCVYHHAHEDAHMTASDYSYDNDENMLVIKHAININISHVIMQMKQ